MDDKSSPTPTTELSGAFAGELHGVLYTTPGDPSTARAVTIGVVVCPGCSSLVFSEGWLGHQSRHEAGLL